MDTQVRLLLRLEAKREQSEVSLYQRIKRKLGRTLLKRSSLAVIALLLFCVSSSATALKDNSIDPKGIQSELILAIIIVNEVYQSFGYEFVITSLNDSEHIEGTLHFNGNAFDARVKHIPLEKRQLLVNRIVKHLNSNYDVVLETNHLHIEYDAKKL